MITRASCILILAGVLIVSVPEFAAAQDPSPTPDPSIVLDPFWDPINGSAAGTGTTTPNGTWSTAVAAWNDASDGTGTVSAWGGTNRAAVFSAGTDATGSYTVTVSGTVKAGSITFEEGAVTLAGTATPSLTISGGVTINSGINGTTTFGSTLGNVVLGGDQSWANNSSQAFKINSGVVADTATRTLTLNGSGSGGSTFSGVLGNGSGTLNLTVNTTGGATTLSGANTYTGATTVNAGTLFVNGSLASGCAVTVSGSGTTLGGTGTINGSVSIGSGSKLQGGTGSTGQTLTLTGAVTMSNGSIFQLALDGSGTHSTIAINGGSLAFAPTASQQHFNFIGTPVVGTYLGIITGVPNPTTTVMNQWVIDNAGYSGSFTWDSTNGGEIDLTLTKVPEPGTWGAAALALLSVGYVQRKRLTRLLTRA